MLIISATAASEHGPTNYPPQIAPKTGNFLLRTNASKRIYSADAVMVAGRQSEGTLKSGHLKCKPKTWML